MTDQVPCALDCDENYMITLNNGLKNSHDYFGNSKHVPQA